MVETISPVGPALTPIPEFGKSIDLSGGSFRPQLDLTISQTQPYTPLGDFNPDRYIPGKLAWDFATEAPKIEVSPSSMHVERELALEIATVNPKTEPAALSETGLDLFLPESQELILKQKGIEQAKPETLLKEKGALQTEETDSTENDWKVLTKKRILPKEKEEELLLIVAEKVLAARDEAFIEAAYKAAEILGKEHITGHDIAAQMPKQSDELKSPISAPGETDGSFSRFVKAVDSFGEVRNLDEAKERGKRANRANNPVDIARERIAKLATEEEKRKVKSGEPDRVARVN